MSELVDSSSARYAVIEARWIDRSPERFVIAYSDEESLRDLISAPSIIALGFSSRDAAAASNENEACFSAAPELQPIPGTLVLAKAVEPGGFHSARRRVRHWFHLAETQMIARRVLQHAAAAAILIFYSRNAISGAVRTLMGASF